MKQTQYRQVPDRTITMQKNDYDRGEREVKQLRNEPEKFIAVTSKWSLGNNCTHYQSRLV